MAGILKALHVNKKHVDPKQQEGRALSLKSEYIIIRIFSSRICHHLAHHAGNLIGTVVDALDPVRYVTPGDRFPVGRSLG